MIQIKTHFVALRDPNIAVGAFSEVAFVTIDLTVQIFFNLCVVFKTHFAELILFTKPVIYIAQSTGTRKLGIKGRDYTRSMSFGHINTKTPCTHN